jgi:hypothetical protein
MNSWGAPQLALSLSKGLAGFATPEPQSSCMAVPALRVESLQEIGRESPAQEAGSSELQAGRSQPFTDVPAKIEPQRIHRKSYHWAEDTRPKESPLRLVPLDRLVTLGQKPWRLYRLS